MNIFHFLYLRVITGFVNIGWMMFTLDKTVAEARKKVRKKTKTSVTIPKFAPKIDLERTRKLILQIQRKNVKPTLFYTGQGSG